MDSDPSDSESQDFQLTTLVKVFAAPEACFSAALANLKRKDVDFQNYLTVAGSHATEAAAPMLT